LRLFYQTDDCVIIGVAEIFYFDNILYVKKVTENTTLSEILRNKEAEKILLKHNLPCLSCPMAALEMERLKIGQVCQLYGIELEKLLADLNRVVYPAR